MSSSSSMRRKMQAIYSGSDSVTLETSYSKEMECYSKEMQCIDSNRNSSSSSSWRLGGEKQVVNAGNENQWNSRHEIAVIVCEMS